uniref:Uncharacterized protein n=1 Tax=Manihot esculenta TaxID=3983 RepID=A0A2C9W5S1_MANES
MKYVKLDKCQLRQDDERWYSESETRDPPRRAGGEHKKHQVTQFVEAMQRVLTARNQQQTKRQSSVSSKDDSL